MKEITAAQVYGLGDQEIVLITRAATSIIDTSPYKTGRDALSEALARELDSFDLEAVEDAAKARSTSQMFRTAITYAFLSYRYPELLADIQREAIRYPWEALEIFPRGK